MCQPYKCKFITDIVKFSLTWLTQMIKKSARIITLYGQSMCICAKKHNIYEFILTRIELKTAYCRAYKDWLFFNLIGKKRNNTPMRHLIVAVDICTNSNDWYFWL